LAGEEFEAIALEPHFFTEGGVVLGLHFMNATSTQHVTLRVGDFDLIEGLFLPALETDFIETVCLVSKGFSNLIDVTACEVVPSGIGNEFIGIAVMIASGFGVVVKLRMV
jgi:hypothetical protein